MNIPSTFSIEPRSAIEQARFNMIDQQIRTWNVYDGQTLDVLGRVRREDFVPLAHRALAFMDIEIPLRGNAEVAALKGETMLSPKVEARLFQDMLLQPGETALEIGAGSGFMAALLAHVASRVVTVEIDPELATMARENLRQAGILNAEVRVADGSQLNSSAGTFDAIVLSGSVASVPQDLLSLLNDGGRLIAIVGEEPMMRATLVRRSGDRFETTQPWDTVAARLQNFPQSPGFKF